MPPELGTLAGGGDLPVLLISACRATGRAYFVIAIDGAGLFVASSTVLG